MGLVASPARPGGNITGPASAGPEVNGKRLELLKEAFPHISRVAFLWEPSVATAYVKEAEVAARALGLTLQFLHPQDSSELDDTFAAMARQRIDGLIVLASPFTLSYRTRVVELVAKSRLPALYSPRDFVDVGGLMAYGPSLPDIFRRAAAYVDKILKGAKPGDLPVERPMKFELVINLKTARALGLTLPPTLLFQADEVLQ
jgi:putative ABC transport system substrate-binding protein